MSNRTTLKGYFNIGDVPTEAQFADLIDSVKVLADAEPWFYGVQIGREMSIDFPWQDIAQFLIPTPPADWQLSCIGLVGADRDLQLRIVDGKGRVILEIDHTSQAVALTLPFQEVDLAWLQEWSIYAHLILQGRLNPDATSPGTMEVHHLAFNSHP